MKIFNYTYIKLLLSTILLTLASTSVQAQDNSMGLSNNDITLIFMCVIAFIVLLVLLIAVALLKLIQTLLNSEMEAKGIVVEHVSWWSKLNESLTGAVPLEEEETIELDHDYDGIKELDNHLPPWWKWLFYLTIVFAVAYLFNYHVLKLSPLQHEEYENTIVQAEKEKANQPTTEEAIDESNIVFSNDATLLANGKTIYERNCVACHKVAGEGGIGPNLTDDYWLHGGSVQDTYHTIANGVVEKGMIAWKEVLSPANINAVNSYIYTLRGTNPDNPKAPQGELYQEEAPAIIVSDSTTVDADSTAVAE
ncbi:c-type cytochrome [Reichenbachiella agarivorans]|uniref:C-type cytochrome n=1 Tax=Reichenbachiella agarivorans TaxID=2979464 RepID=A0ABY6CPY6_9BACT|nr:cbb3-type cytochrome c oxidase N-terminal domain-containing protein [Reichenbachiella agarivorans]UXP31423.1 c-type cytochrome [Reichenbachiella agarivorans]